MTTSKTIAGLIGPTLVAIAAGIAVEHWLVPCIGGTGFPRPRAHLRVWYPLIRRWAYHCVRSQSLDERMAGASDRPWLAVRPGWPCPNPFSNRIAAIAAGIGQTTGALVAGAIVLLGLGAFLSLKAYRRD